MNISILEILVYLEDWGMEHGLRIIVAVVIAYLLSKFLYKILDRIIRKLVLKSFYTTQEEEKKRENTLIKISHSFFAILIWIATIAFVLSEFGIPIAPLITGAGIIGVAVGFGSQSLIKDIITGLFIIIENQYRIGDFICVGDYCGTVEDMTMRVTKLRNIDGTIHYIPNGEIKIASNKSKDYSKVDFKIGVGYDTDIDKLEKIINKTGELLSQDPKFKDYIIEPPQFLRIDDFGDYSINIHILGKTLPKKQYLVTGEMRRRLKKMFEENDIRIPYPTRVVHNMKD